MKENGNEGAMRAFAPASVSNIGSGFDVLGFALKEPGDIVSVRRKPGPGILIVNRTPYDLPADPEKNAAGRGVLHLLEVSGMQRTGLEITIERKIPPGSGIGSSAASAVAAVFATNELLGLSVSRHDLLPFCLSGEEAATLSRHADNVAPSLMGGFCLVECHEPPVIVPLPVPDFLYCAVVHPELVLRTSDARNVLKKEIPLGAASRQWARMGTLVAGLYTGNPEWIRRGMEDELIEPQRSPLIKGFKEVKQAAIDAGALNSTLSGSGPSVFALCEGKQTAVRVGEKMLEAFRRNGTGANLYISRPGAEGVRILKDRQG